VNFIFKIISVLTLITAIEQLQCGEQNVWQELYSIVVPGQNGKGGKKFIKHGVINTAKLSNYSTRRTKVDLGQDNCIQHFEEQYNRDPSAKSGNNMLFGVSQGTATLVNSLARKTHNQQEGTTKCLVLESVLGHGNSAIMHTLSNIPVLAYLPFARFWVPWLAKVFVFPTYKPHGKQVFSSAKKLSPNIPIVIMHDKNDPQLSINDARKTYCALKSRESDQNNVYLLEVEAPHGLGRHIDILRNNPVQQAALQVIYKKHGLPYKQNIDTANVDLTLYQPSVKEVRSRINKSSRLSFWIRSIVDTLAATAITGAVYLRYCQRP
jgi:hypothetical protein